MPPSAPQRSRHAMLLLPFLVFVLAGAVYFWHAMGDDLASSFVGCRVLASGNGTALYSHDPVNFAGIADSDTVWPLLAASAGYHGYLHPYVQTPLWAFALQPLCRHMRWPGFEHLFLVLSLCSLAAIVYLSARFWSPALYTPGALAAVLLLLASSEPFLFAMELVQTHALLLLLTVSALLLAERKRANLAGLCVACAAAVKITPAVLVLYWIASRRWRSAISFLIWSIVLLVLTRCVVGSALFRAYLEGMHRVSNVLLVSENNQSLASWLLGHRFAPDEVFDVNSYPLPTVMRWASLACMAVFAALGGVLDRDTRPSASPQRDSLKRPPFGAGIVLIAMTVFAPIAWTHYYVVLAIPLMLLAESLHRVSQGWARMALTGALVPIAALLYKPLAPDVIRMDLSDYAVLHGTVLAAFAMLLLLLWAAVASRRQPANP